MFRSTYRSTYHFTYHSAYRSVYHSTHTTPHATPHAIPHTISRYHSGSHSTYHSTDHSTYHSTYHSVPSTAHIILCRESNSFQQYVLCDWRPLLPVTDPAAGGVGGCSIVGPAYTLCVRPQRQNRYSCLRSVSQGSLSRQSASQSRPSVKVVSQGRQSRK